MKKILLLILLLPNLTFASYSSYTRTPSDNPLMYENQPVNLAADVVVTDECFDVATAYGVYIDDSVTTPSPYFIGSGVGDVSFSINQTFPVSPQVRAYIFYFVDEADVENYALACGNSGVIDDFVVEGSPTPPSDATSTAIQASGYIGGGIALWFFMFFAMIYIVTRIL